MIKTTSPLYLASASPRRHEILSQMGVKHRVLRVPPAPGEDEPQLLNEKPHDYVRRTASEKAALAAHWVKAQKLDVLPILSADTIVVLDEHVLGKPTSTQDAVSILQRLSGRTHYVQTAIVLIDVTGQLHKDECITQVRIRRLSLAEINAYCATTEPWGKAGAYGIQGSASLFIEHISGSYSGVMGLPIYETGRLLQKAGLLAIH